MQQPQTISWSDCDVWWKVDCKRQLVTTSQLSGWTEKKLQSTSQGQTCSKKRSRSLFGGLLPIWATWAFWIPAKPVHLRSMPSNWWKLQSLQPVLVNRKGPVLHNNNWPHFAQPTLQKLNELVYKLLPHPPHSLDLSPTSYHSTSISAAVCRENASTTNRMQKMFSKSFHATGINKFISCWQNVLIIMVPILTNKDMFEPSYNDLKFMLLLLLSHFSHVRLCVTP